MTEKGTEKENNTLFSELHLPSISVRWWLSLPLGGRYKHVKLWIPKHRPEDCHRGCFCLGFQDRFILKYRLDGDILLYTLM